MKYDKRFKVKEGDLLAMRKGGKVYPVRKNLKANTLLAGFHTKDGLSQTGFVQGVELPQPGKGEEAGG